MSSPYPLTNADIGKNSYFWATQRVLDWTITLPRLADRGRQPGEAGVGITDSPLTATIDQDPAQGLKDQREMSATLVTVTAGSDAAGSEGVSPAPPGPERGTAASDTGTRRPGA